MGRMISILASILLSACLFDNEVKPGKVYYASGCSDSKPDSITYIDSTDATSFHIACEIDSVSGEPKPPHP